MSLVKMENNLYSEEELNNYIDLMKEHFYVGGIINCPYVESNNIVDTLILIPKTELINRNEQTRLRKEGTEISRSKRKPNK